MIRFEEKSWGDYRVIDVSDTSLTVKISLRKDCSMAYHSHERRDEVWTIVKGKGRALVDGVASNVGPGDVIRLPRGSKHAITAYTDIEMIEVQLGTDIDVTDKKKYELE